MQLFFSYVLPAYPGLQDRKGEGFTVNSWNDLSVKYNTVSFQECISRNLRVMDMTAFTLCMENKLPIIVFDMNEPGNLYRVVTGEKVGTLVRD